MLMRRKNQSAMTYNVGWDVAADFLVVDGVPEGPESGKGRWAAFVPWFLSPEEVDDLYLVAMPKTKRLRG